LKQNNSDKAAIKRMERFGKKGENESVLERKGLTK
jgi:hypothetical protein